MTIQVAPHQSATPMGDAALAAPLELALHVPIRGMTCAACVRRVENAILAAPGVSAVSVNLATERATVTLAADGAVAPVQAAIRTAGYEPVEDESEYLIEGMSCAACIRRVENAMTAVPGVLAASANLATNRASARYLGGLETKTRLIAALREAGYRAEAAQSGEQQAEREKARRAAELATLARKVLVAAALTLPLVLIEMGGHIHEPFHHWLAATFGLDRLRLAAFLLATGVQFGPGLDFQRKGVTGLRRGAPDMNSLVMLGSMAAYVYSSVATFRPGLLPAGGAVTYFESAAVVITLVLVGRFLEARAKGRAGDAIRRLLRLEAKSALLLRDGVESETPIEAVKAGDLLRVRPGARVPVDGVVVEGASFVDEAMITGEPIPARKDVGAQVTGGTINGAGAFTFRAVKVGSDTLLAQIVRTIEAAQAAKLPIQGLVDRVTAYFVPVVMALAAMAFLLWWLVGPEPTLARALAAGVAVLIIACPCAMGLATPISIMVASGRAAEFGVLFRRGDALQVLRDAEVIAFDKTGTLTRGKPELTDLMVAPGADATETLRFAASVEARSEHPIAQAIVKAAQSRGLALGDAGGFAATPGLGAAASVAGHAVLIGSERFLRERGVETSGLAETAARFAAEGKSPVLVAIDGRATGVVAVADQPKETSAAAISALRRMGRRIVMVTGDNRLAAEAIAQRLGVEEVIAEVLPTDKAAVVARLKAGGARVAFVGDGVNDAPALAAADIGVAIGQGADIAIESADVVLMSGDPRHVANAIALSAATMTNVKQNLFWAFGYNVVLIPVAAGALYPVFGIVMSPIFAGAAMALSSVSVVANALRLRGFKPPLAAPGEPLTALPGRLAKVASP